MGISSIVGKPDKSISCFVNGGISESTLGNIPQIFSDDSLTFYSMLILTDFSIVVSKVFMARIWKNSVNYSQPLGTIRIVTHLVCDLLVSSSQASVTSIGLKAVISQYGPYIG